MCVVGYIAVAALVGVVAYGVKFGFDEILDIQVVKANISGLFR